MRKYYSPSTPTMKKPFHNKIHNTKMRSTRKEKNFISLFLSLYFCFRNYKVQSTGMKQWYLLSVFLGDVIRDVPLCKQLAKHLDCSRGNKPFTRD